MTKNEFIDKYGIQPHKDILRGNNIATASLKECSKHKVVPTEYGISYCQKCEDGWRKSPIKKKVPYPEFTTDKIREGRKQFASDQIQEFRQGDLSREYVELFPNQIKQKIKDGVLTKEQVIKSKYVWKEKELKNWERNKKVDAEMI